jgi:hypothetical protein
MVTVLTGDPPTRIDEPPRIYSHVGPGGVLVEWHSQFVLADATDTTKKHELSKHQEHSLRIILIQGTNHKFTAWRKKLKKNYGLIG